MFSKRCLRKTWIAYPKTPSVRGSSTSRSNHSYHESVKKHCQETLLFTMPKCIMVGTMPKKLASFSIYILLSGVNDAKLFILHIIKTD